MALSDADGLSRPSTTEDFIRPLATPSTRSTPRAVTECESPRRHRAVSTAKFDSCAASRGEEERGELAAHCRCCCCYLCVCCFRSVNVTRSLHRSMPLRACSIAALRAPAASGRACVRCYSCPAACFVASVAAKSLLWPRLQVAGACQFCGSAAGACRGG